MNDSPRKTDKITDWEEVAISPGDTVKWKPRSGLGTSNGKVITANTGDPTILVEYNTGYMTKKINLERSRVIAVMRS